MDTAVSAIDYLFTAPDATAPATQKMPEIQESFASVQRRVDSAYQHDNQPVASSDNSTSAPQRDDLSSKPQENNRSTTIEDDNQSSPALDQSETTDNIHENPKTIDNSQPKQENETVDQRDNLPDAAQKEQKDHSPDAKTAVAKQPEIVQLWIQQYATDKQPGEKGPKRIMQPKAGKQLASQLANARTDKNQPDATETTNASAIPTSTPVKTNATAAAVIAQEASPNNNLAESAQTKPSNNASLVAQVANQQKNTEESRSSTDKPDQPKKEILSKTLEVFTQPQAKPESTNKQNQGSQIPISLQNQKIKSIDVAQMQSNAQTKPIKANPENYKQANLQNDGKGADSKTLDSGNPLLSATKTNEQQSENSMVDSLIEKINGNESQTSKGLLNQQKSGSQNNSNSTTNQILSAGALENSVKETSQVTNITGNNLPQSTNTMAKDGISQQIFESIHGSLQKNQQQITIQLNPPELGRILIKFQESDEKITGLLEVSKPEIRQQIEQALPEILKTLQNAGIQFKRLEVTVNDQPHQQLTKEQNLQGDNFGHNAPGGSDNLDNRSTDQGYDADNFYNDFDQPQFFDADESLNVLI